MWRLMFSCLQYWNSANLDWKFILEHPKIELNGYLKYLSRIIELMLKMSGLLFDVFS